MSKITLIFLLLCSFLFNANANASVVSYADGQGYSGEILFQNIGAFYVDNGVLNLKGFNIPNGTQSFIPFTDKSFTYLGEFEGKDIVLPTSDISRKDFALYNIYVDLPANNYEVFFHNSNTSKLTKQSLIIPYLHKVNTASMIIRDKDNFSVINFDIPTNTKEVINLKLDSQVPKISGHFSININNKYLQLDNPEITHSDNSLVITDTVADYSKKIQVYRNLFSLKYYQNVTYILNLDDNKVTQGLSDLSDKKYVFSMQIGDIIVDISTSLNLTDLSSKIDDKKILADNVNKSVEQTKEGGKGILYYGVYFIAGIFVISLCWYFNDKISLFLFKTGKFKDDLVENIIRKDFVGIIHYTKDDSFIKIILQLKKLPSNKLNIESVDSVINSLNSISKRISNNLQLKEELLYKKNLIDSKLKDADKLIKTNKIEVRFSTVNLAKTIKSCENAILILKEKLSKIDSLNESYASKFQDYCTYLSKYLLDVEMDQISDSINFNSLLEDDADVTASRDLYNLKDIEKSLEYLKNYDEALKEVISPLEQQKISQLKK